MAILETVLPDPCVQQGENEVLASYNWIFGVIIYMFGSVIINLGTNLMKLSHNKNERKIKAERKPAYKQGWWWIGMSVFSAGNVLNFVAFSFAAQSLLAAVGSVQFVSNLIFATMVLKEKLTRRAIFGTCLIVVGNVLIVTFASHESHELSVEQLKALYKQTIFIVYIIFLAILVTIIHIGFVTVKNLVEQQQKISSSSLWALLFLPTAYAAVSAMIGTHSVLLGKSVSELLRTTVFGNNQFSNWFTYIILFGFLVINVFWMIRMNTAIRKYPAMYIVPALQVIWIVTSILSGGIYFREFQCFSTLQYFMFILGVGVIVVGVYFLAPAQKKGSLSSENYEELADQKPQTSQERTFQAAGPARLTIDLQAVTETNSTELDLESPLTPPSVARLHPPQSSHPPASPLISISRVSRVIQYATTIGNAMPVFSFEGENEDDSQPDESSENHQEKVEEVLDTEVDVEVGQSDEPAKDPRQHAEYEELLPTEEPEDDEEGLGLSDKESEESLSDDEEQFA